VFARPVDEIPDDQEVVVETGDVDDGEFVAGAQDQELPGLESGVVGRSRFLTGGEIA
jgi:hypothetical protein